MNSLSKHWKRNEHPTSKSKFVGCYVAPEISELISLYAVAHQVSKSDVVRTILYEWCGNKSLEKSALVSVIVGRIQSEWNRKKLLQQTKPTVVTFEEFMQGIEAGLTKQGVAVTQINTIKRKVMQ